MSNDFEAALLHIVAPRLQPLGYVYEAALRVDDEVFGFCKMLSHATQAVIQFQRQSDPTLDRFTVNVLRGPADDNDVQARAARLSYVLWFVYKRRDYAVSDHWWTASNSAQREAALLDAVEKIERYGIPWIEALDAPKPWEMPLSRAEEFGEAVQEVMAREMERLGYQAACQSLSGNVPYCYFSKALPDGRYALIELQAIYSLDPAEFIFDVRLQRRANRDPLAFDGNDEHGRSVSLAQFIRQTRGGSSLDRLAVPDVKTLLWHYRDRAELDAQLIAALEQIKQFGCAWVEQAAESKVIQ